MRVSRDEVRRIANLAHLAFDDAGLDRMAEELTKILSYIDQLSEVDVRGFEEHGEGTTPLRDDTPRPSTDTSLVARNAPQWSDAHFVVPNVVPPSPAAGPAASPPPKVPR